MSDFEIPSSTIWLNSAHIERWLGGLWPGWRARDIRHGWDNESCWYWVAPDYDRGRSRVIGISMSLLETTTLSRFQEILESHDWTHRVGEVALLIGKSEEGEWTVEAWNPDIEEAWFSDPNGGYFVAFKDQSGGISVGPFLPDPPTPFLALHGKEWSAMGPKDPRDPRSYSVEELKPFIPAVNRAQA